MATLFEFKAGQVDFTSESGDAVPLAGQGRVVLKHSSEDPSFLGLQWFPRAKNRDPSGEELLLLPGDVEFSHSKECQTGRVVQMQFQSSGERHFFWLQDAPAGDLDELSERDAGIIAKLNDLVNQFDPEDDGGDDGGDDSMQVDESTPLTRDEESPSSTSGKVLHLQSALTSALARNLEHAGIGRAPKSQPQPQFQPQPQPQPQLQQSQNQSLVRRYDSAARAAYVASASDERLARLLTHARGAAATRDELLEVVRSPHFASALDGLGRAVLESPALAREIGLTRQPASVDDFVQLLSELVEKDEDGGSN